MPHEKLYTCNYPPVGQIYYFLVLICSKNSISDVTKAGHCRLAAVDGSLEACPTDCAPGPQSFSLFLFLDFTEYLGVPVSGSTVSNR